jgi:hypothetical protein
MALSSVASTLLNGSGSTWNRGSLQPSLVTYSFATQENGPNATGGQPSWMPFNEAQKASAREALEAWGSVSGLRFLEVPDTSRGSNIDIRFQIDALDGNTAGRSWYPQVGDVSISLEQHGQDPMLPGSYGYLVLLHEIGHAIGLKHPFDGSPVLPGSLNNFDTTVMAYPQEGFATPASLRAVDVEAVQYLYGTQQDEENAPVHWSWDAALGGIRHEANDLPQIIYGTGLRDIIIGLGGDDVLNGNAGDDELYGGEGNDTLSGQDGDDLLAGSTGAEYLYGGNGRDRLYGQEDDDVLYGQAGDDLLSGGVGSNTADGGAGTDTLVVGLLRLQASLSPLDWSYQSDSSHKSYSAIVAGGPETTRFVDMEVVAFTDGRLVFDVNDPAAQVMRLYQAALGRDPDAVGSEGWIDRLAQGTPLSSLAQGFLGSDEFQARFGSPDNAGFVTRAYQQALGREPDAAGFAFWQDQLAGGMSRAELLAGFSESTENRARTEPLLAQGLWDVDNGMAGVARLYQAVLGRVPDSQGLLAWDAQADAGMTTAQMANLFAASAEFQARFPGAADAAFVQLVYQNALGRQADPTGEAFWLNHLNQGMTRGELVAGFADSTEFLQLSSHLTDHGIVFA